MLARKSKWKTGLIIVGMLAPALLIAVGIVIYPIINTIIKSFMDSKTGAFTFSNYVYLFTNKLARAHVWYTFWITCLTVVFAIAISYLAGAVPALLERQNREIHRNALSAAALHSRSCRRLRNEDRHQRFPVF